MYPYKFLVSNVLFLYSLCPICFAQKVIYSYVGNRDKPIASMQVSDREFGNPHDKDSEWFSKGLTRYDSIHWTIYSFKIPTKSFVILIDTIVKHLGTDYETFIKKKTYWGAFAITILDGDEIQRYYYVKEDFLQLCREQVEALKNDPQTYQVRDYLQQLKFKVMNMK